MSYEPMLKKIPEVPVSEPDIENQQADLLALYDRLISERRFGYAVVEYFKVQDGVVLGFFNRLLLTDSYYGLPSDQLIELANLSHFTLKGTPLPGIISPMITRRPIAVDTVEAAFNYFKYLKKRNALFGAARAIAIYITVIGIFLFFGAPAIFTSYWDQGRI